MTTVSALWEPDVQAAAERLGDAYIQADGKKLSSNLHASFFSGIPPHLRDEVRTRARARFKQAMRNR